MGISEQLLLRLVRNQRVVCWGRNLELENLEVPDILFQLILCDELIA